MRFYIGVSRKQRKSVLNSVYNCQLKLYSLNDRCNKKRKQKDWKSQKRDSIFAFRPLCRLRPLRQIKTRLRWQKSSQIYLGRIWSGSRSSGTTSASSSTTSLSSLLLRPSLSNCIDLLLTSSSSASVSSHNNNYNNYQPSSLQPLCHHKLPCYHCCHGGPGEANPSTVYWIRRNPSATCPIWEVP